MTENIDGWTEAIDGTDSHVPETLAGVLQYWAACQPERPALIDPLGTISYRELADMAGRAGRVLAGLGLRRDSRVALISSSGPTIARAFPGIASHVPCALIDPGSSAETCRELFQRLRIEAVAADRGGMPAARAATTSRPCQRCSASARAILAMWPAASSAKNWPCKSPALSRAET